MKPLFLLITICILFSCSDNNDEIDDERLVTNFKTLYETTIYFEDLYKMVEGDSIFKIGGNAKTGTFSYAITSQIPENAFKIDSETGVIRVNDDTRIDVVPENGVFIIYGEIRNQGKSAVFRLNLYLDISITRECDKASNRFSESLSEVISDDVYSVLDIEGNAFQISFSVKSEKSLCRIDHWFVSNNSDPISVELTDAEGENLLKANRLGFDADGWAGPDYRYLYDFSLQNLDILLKPNEIYTLKATGNHFVSYVHMKQNDETIVFPIDLDVFTILGTQYTGKDGNIYTDNAIMYGTYNY